LFRTFVTRFKDVDTTVIVMLLGKCSFAIRRFRFEDNIKYAVRKMEWVDFDWNRLLQFREKRPDVVKNVMEKLIY
jgi:hypothetical protein